MGFLDWMFSRLRPKMEGPDVPRPVYTVGRKPNSVLMKPSAPKDGNAADFSEGNFGKGSVSRRFLTRIERNSKNEQVEMMVPDKRNFEREQFEEEMPAERNFKEGPGAYPFLRSKSRSRGGSAFEKESFILKDVNAQHIAALKFNFHELAAATKNFSDLCLLGEGGFGRVYKGCLGSNGLFVAVKQLNKSGIQGHREFLAEVNTLSSLRHPNIVTLIGFCADGDERLLVYEFMPLGSLKDHLHDVIPYKKPLDWNTRMKIAAGAARGLEYLHDKANFPIIHRDIKSSNILLDEGFFPKLSDFGIAKLGPFGDETHVSTRIIGTNGYCAPEYATTGRLTPKSDMYSFGVVLLELITGRKAIDITRPTGEQNLVAWARYLFRDKNAFPKLADPLLQGCYPTRDICKALDIAAMCLQEVEAARPPIWVVAPALLGLASQTCNPSAAATPSLSRATSRARVDLNVNREFGFVKAQKGRMFGYNQGAAATPSLSRAPTRARENLKVNNVRDNPSIAATPRLSRAPTRAREDQNVDREFVFDDVWKAKVFGNLDTVSKV